MTCRFNKPIMKAPLTSTSSGWPMKRLRIVAHQQWPINCDSSRRWQLVCDWSESISAFPSHLHTGHSPKGTRRRQTTPWLSWRHEGCLICIRNRVAHRGGSSFAYAHGFDSKWKRRCQNVSETFFFWFFIFFLNNKKEARHGTRSEAASMMNRAQCIIYNLTNSNGAAVRGRQTAAPFPTCRVVRNNTKCFWMHHLLLY